MVDKIHILEQELLRKDKKIQELEERLNVLMKVSLKRSQKYDQLKEKYNVLKSSNSVKKG